MSNKRITDLAEILGEMNGGVLIQQAGQALSDIALNVCALEGKKRGKVIIELDITRIGDARQVEISHKIKTTIPREKGRSIEEVEGSTPFHVGSGGVITLFPDRQLPMEMSAGAATGRTDGVHG